MTAAGIPGVLLVTRRAALPELAWADLAASGAEGLAKWRVSRHSVVLADFGDLGDGMTGARLAAALRAEDPDVLVLLLTDRVQTHQRAWAQRHGADVIERTADAVAAALPPSVRPTRPSGLPSCVPAAESLEPLVEVVCDRLQRYGRMGPARTLVVRDAVEALVVELGTLPTVDDLAARVALEIDSADARAAFLNSFSKGEQ